MAVSRTLSLAAAFAAVQVVAVDMPLVAKTFSKYPGYTGDLSVSDAVVSFGKTANDELVLWWTFSGGDSTCIGVDNGEANTCGLHIHSGTSCETASAVGGHYFTGSVDPWAAVQYSVTSGASSKTNVLVKAGTTLSDNRGRVVVIHDASGARIACSVLAVASKTAGTTGMEAGTSDTKGMEAGSFAKYPGYSGSLSVSGSVELVQTAGVMQSAPGLVMNYRLSGTDPNCPATADRSKANACGIHVHVGNCSSSESVGGHYHKSGMPTDPWQHAVYFAGEDAATGSSTSVVIDMGEPVMSVKGRSLVVHDLEGSRVACADIRESTLLV